MPPRVFEKPVRVKPLEQQVCDQYGISSYELADLYNAAKGSRLSAPLPNRVLAEAARIAAAEAAADKREPVRRRA